MLRARFALPILLATALAQVLGHGRAVAKDEVINITQCAHGTWENGPNGGSCNCYFGYVSTNGGKTCVAGSSSPLPSNGGGPGTNPGPTGSGGHGDSEDEVDPCEDCNQSRIACLAEAQLDNTQCEGTDAIIVAQEMCKAGKDIAGFNFTPGGKYVRGACLEWGTTLPDGDLGDPLPGPFSPGHGGGHPVCKKYSQVWVPEVSQACVNRWLNGVNNWTGGNDVKVGISSLQVTVSKKDGLLNGYCTPNLLEDLAECTEDHPCEKPASGVCGWK